MNPEENPTPTDPSANPVPAPQVVPSEPQPTTPQPVVSAPEVAPASPSVGGPVVASPSTPVSSGGSGKKRWLVPAIIAAVVVVLLGGGYVFAFYLPNQPDNIYNSGITNSGKALDKLISYAQTQSKTSYSSATFDGTIKVKASGASFDASLNGAFDKNANGTLELKADVEGQNITANLRSIKAAGNTSPDLYLQVSGVKSILDTYGLGSLDSQWISVDHTLLDSYAKQYSSLLGSGALSTVGGLKTGSTSPTVAQINDAVAKVQAVNKQYIFTTDSSKAILVKQKFVGKETQNGRSVDHFTVGYNKDHLASYVQAVATALDGSTLNTWAKSEDSGKSISQAINVDQAVAGIKNAKTNDASSFDLFVDTKTKLISSIQFTDSTDKTSKVTIGQSYTGGSVYPFFVGFSGTGTTGQLGLSVDTAKNTYKLTFDFSEGSDLSTNITVDVTPSNKTVTVTAPTGAKSINDVLSQFGAGGLLGGSDTTDTSLLN